MKVLLQKEEMMVGTKEMVASARPNNPLSSPETSDAFGTGQSTDSEVSRSPFSLIDKARVHASPEVRP